MKLTLGDRLTVLRKKRKFTLEQLGKLTGVRTTTIEDFENDAEQPSLDKLIELANALQVSLDFLTGRTEYELEFQNIQRILELQNMSGRYQETAYYAIDALIRASKTEHIYQNSD